MKRYITPQIKMNTFDVSVTATENILSMTDYICANEVINNVSFTDYFTQKATSTKIHNVLNLK